MALVGGVGNRDKGFDLGPAEFYVSKAQSGRNTKWAFDLGRGVSQGWVCEMGGIRYPVDSIWSLGKDGFS